MPRKRCYNCKHGGNKFKISGKTHLHCHHSKYKEEDMQSGKITPWDTLCEFSWSCADFEQK